MADVLRFPVSSAERRQNRLGPRTVSDEVSGRALHFGAISPAMTVGHLVEVDVHADPGGDQDALGRRICSMYLSVEVLRQLIADLEREMAVIDARNDNE